MKVQETIRTLRHFADTLDTSQVLGSVGLQRRHGFVDYALPAVGILAVGILVGGGLALLFARMDGSKLRREIAIDLGKTTDKVQAAAASIAHAVTPDGVQPPRAASGDGLHASKRG